MEEKRYEVQAIQRLFLRKLFIQCRNIDITPEEATDLVLKEIAKYYTPKLQEPAE